MPSPNETATASDYWALPEGVRAELIDGELWSLASPTRMHQRLVFQIARRIEDHIDDWKGDCQVYVAPFAVNLFGDDTTFVEPDVSVVCDRSKLSNRGCEGAPDLVVEVVSPLSVSMDYVTKLNLYRMAGVREYWVCDPIKERTIVYAFGTDADPMETYSFVEPVRSTVFDGLVVDVAAIVAGSLCRGGSE